MAKLPLEGIRVLEIGIIWAAPFAGLILADLGAEVIKVESIHHIPPATRGYRIRPPQVAMSGPTGATYPNRETGERPYNRFSLFNVQHRNKYSMTVDLRKDKGKEVFKKLVAVSDVFVENNAYGLMDRFGLGYSVLSRVNPKLIMCSMPGYGNTGPYKEYVGFGLLLEALIGHAWLRGYADSDPTTNNPAYPCDTTGGATAAFMILSALRHRKRTGRGQLIDLAQTEAFMPHLGQSIMDYTMNGRVQRTVGNRDSGLSMAPHGCYCCKGHDRWLVIAVSSDEEWRGLCRAMGEPAWTKEVRFSDALSRLRNHDEMDKLIEAWTLNHDHYALMHLLQREGVPAGPVMDGRDCYNDPHLKERGFLVRVTHPEAGTHLYPGFMVKMYGTPLTYRMPAPCLGEHNEYVYKKLLGVPDAEYAALEREQHIGMEYLGPG